MKLLSGVRPIQTAGAALYDGSWKTRATKKYFARTGVYRTFARLNGTHLQFSHLLDKTLLCALSQRGSGGGGGGDIKLPGHFHEALVQREVVPDGVLPALLVFPEEWICVDDELVNLAEGDLKRK